MLSCQAQICSNTCYNHHSLALSPRLPPLHAPQPPPHNDQLYLGSSSAQSREFSGTGRFFPSSASVLSTFGKAACVQAGVLNVSPNISRCSHSSWVVLIALYSSRCGGKKKKKTTLFSDFLGMSRQKEVGEKTL